MPAVVDASVVPGPITREMLFQLMVLARDTSFPDAQIRAICDTVTQENANDSIELLRRLQASQETSLVLASAVAPMKLAATPRSKPQLPQTSTEPGAVLCADTFYRLCKDDRTKLQRLGTFCPFTLAFRKCPHGLRCRRPASCNFSHEVTPTCDSVYDGTRCSRTRRLVNDNKRRACPRNHDYKTRLFMGAMRVPHELGFYGVDYDHAGLSATPPSERDNTAGASWMAPSTTPPTAIGDAVGASWMTANVEENNSEHEEPFTVAEAEENDISGEVPEKSATLDAVPDPDLILFT
ncbi:unnamed protein product [Aureobasidium mustum]|uniref:C3H1-type domain-containing protein n=1 Tax=Aureobasidium mustum TaxID=2773714 RepID=A0A9N8KBG1_9PEZI|nr:unnamed protein product [Aureobasidium mustum]